ncbi:MAG: hypothetical protein EKK42_35360 [Pseudonocardiaceae bacterium]|nr:MAG: hypothetical protein EKK42_35360 [Pseudonocardiaceae bacterium]
MSSAEQPDPDVAEQERDVVDDAPDPERATEVVPPEVNRLAEADQADVLDQLTEAGGETDDPDGRG